MKTMMGNKGFAQLWMLIGLVVMAVALPAASILVSKNQDNRNKAAGNSVCYPSNGTTICYYPTDVPASPTKVPTLVPSTPTSVAQVIPTTASCFLPGTLVSTTDGTKKIEEVTEGDVVLSFDNQNKVNSSVVSNLMNFSRDYYYRLVTANSEVKVTAEHPFYRGNGEFTQVKDLNVGDVVYVLEDGKLVGDKITALQRVDEQTQVFNMTVEEDHTYFANGFAVHNKNVAIPPQGLICSQGDTAKAKCQEKYGSLAGAYGSCPAGYIYKGVGRTWVPTTRVAGVTVQVPGCIEQKCCVPPVSDSQKLDACNGNTYTVNTSLNEVVINGTTIKKGVAHTFSTYGWKCDSSKKNGSCALSAVTGITDLNKKSVTVTNNKKCYVGKTYSGYCCP